MESELNRSSILDICVESKLLAWISNCNYITNTAIDKLKLSQIVSKYFSIVLQLQLQFVSFNKFCLYSFAILTGLLIY